LTLKQGDKLITLHAHHITLAKIEDEKEAEEILKWLQDLVNETYQNRDKIEPNYLMSRELKPTDIYKLLPGTNCKECGQASCFAFAFKLVRKETEIKKCLPLFSGKYLERREVLFGLLYNAGYELPDAKLTLERSQEGEEEEKMLLQNYT